MIWLVGSEPLPEAFLWCLWCRTQAPKAARYRWVTPATQPMTMPASWPPLNLFLCAAGAAAVDGLGVEAVVTIFDAATLPRPELMKMVERAFASCTQKFSNQFQALMLFVGCC